MQKLIKIIKIPKIEDDGYLCFAEHPEHIPFEIRRVYYITSPIKGLARGKHTHQKTRQILFCIRGSVRMVLDDGKKKEEVVLSDPENGIVLEPMIWHEMLGMNEDTVLLVLASEKYEAKDYIRDYSEFLKLANK